MSVQPKVKIEVYKKLEDKRIHARETISQVIQRLLELSEHQSKFIIDDVREIARTLNFKIKINETIGNVVVIRAVKDDIHIDCTQNLIADKTINLTIVKSFQNINYERYTKLQETFTDFDVIIGIDGDLDTINILNNPEQYDLKLKEAFSFIIKKNKKIGATVAIKLNNQQNTIEYLRTSIERLR